MMFTEQSKRKERTRYRLSKSETSWVSKMFILFTSPHEDATREAESSFPEQMYNFKRNWSIFKISVATTRAVNTYWLRYRYLQQIRFCVIFEEKPRSRTGQSLSKDPFYGSQTHETANGSRNRVSESRVPHFSAWQQHRLFFNSCTST